MSENGFGTAGHDTAEALVAEAESLGEQDRWHEAHQLLADELESHAEDPRVLCWLGIAAQRLDEEGEAYDMFRRALALQPEDPFVLAVAGTAVAALDDPAGEGALRMAALTAPDFPFARQAYGAYLAREGLFDEALVELEAARRLAPDDAAIHMELGIALLLARKTREGLDALEEALSFAPDDSWLRALFGLALADAGRGEESAEQLHQAAGERPEDVEVQLLAALAMGAQGWEDPAWEAFARAEGAADSADGALLAEVEDRLTAGPDEAEQFLRVDLGPTLLRERLTQRT
jgi:Flp pilus assembly protein TadD